MRNPGLEAAVQVFKDLGWADATPDQVMSLPVGTKEQQRTALAGLRTGDWSELGEVSKNRWGEVWRVDADPVMLALFAVRVGADARRAVAVLGWKAYDDQALTAVVAERGAAYASKFIEVACVPSRRWSDSGLSTHGAVAVRLVADLGLPVPDNAEYVKDWAVQAARVLGVDTWTGLHDHPVPDEAVISERFAEHVRTGVATGVPATGPFSEVLAVGVGRGWFNRAEAVDLVFAGLDQSVRPGDRKAWLGVLDRLGVTDAELVARADALVPLLSLGDSFAVQRLAPLLIAGADDGTVVEALVAALTISVRKTQRLVLDAALARSRPSGAEDLEAQLGTLALDRDKDVASRASKLMDQWGLTREDARQEAEPVRGLWQPAPPVWTVPRFDHGPETPEALTALAAELTGRPGGVDDIVAERFLAVANAVARRDEAGARAALRGVQWTDVYGLEPVEAWVAGRPPRWGLDTWYSGDTRLKKLHCYHPLEARQHAIFQRLGQVPCLLSEPSRDDLSVDAADLVSRLETYAAEGADCIEADLLVALLRTDPATATPDQMTRLSGLGVRVVLQSGKRMKTSAGAAAAAYLADPVVEPPLEKVGDQSRFWGSRPVERPGSLGDFPDRFSWLAHRRSDFYAVFPHWGDAGLKAVGGSSWDTPREQGLVLRQVARRARPLPPAGAINFLGAQRSVHAAAAEDSALAVAEAWQRGLLRPGVADVAYLDWVAAPANLAALASALAEIAQTSLLSVVWPVLHDLVGASLRAVRLLAGTAEILDAMSVLLDEVLSAVRTGAAEPGVLDLPAVRELAGRTGSSRAVSLAREIVARLPARSVPRAEPVARVTDPPFEAFWQYDNSTLPRLADGVEVTATSVAGAKAIRLALTLPDRPGERFLFDVPGWNYPLRAEGQVQAFQVPTGEADTDVPRLRDLNHPQVWLHWDADKDRLAVEPYRNWRTGKDDSPGGEPAPLSDALVTALVAMFIEGGWDASSYVKAMIKERRLGPAAVAAAARMLLRSLGVSPSRLVGELEKDAYLLPALWPLLTESVAHAASLPGNPPAWLSRVLSVALQYAPYLAEAARRGWIPAEAACWPGLADIAARPGKSASIAKAKELISVVLTGQAVSLEDAFRAMPDTGMIDVEFPRSSELPRAAVFD